MSLSLQGARASRSLGSLLLLAAVAACSERVQPTSPAIRLDGGRSVASFNSSATTASEYEFVVGRYGYWQAKANAEAAGGHLATIGSAEEQAQIVALAASIGLPQNQYWIGGTRDGGNRLCGWTWLDGTRIPVNRAGACFTEGYSNWNILNPSGDGGGLSLLWVPNDPNQRGQWNDADGDQQFGYLIERAANRAPAISLSAVGGTEGSAVAISISAADEEGGAPTITYDLGDGTTGSGPFQGTHVYRQDGSYVVTVTATDGKATVTATETVIITNVLPVLSALPPASILVGESYVATGSFTDPGADLWSATVDYGAGAGPLALIGKTFALSHKYSTSGSFTVVVRVSDDDGSGQASAVVTVLSPVQGVQNLTTMVTDLAASGAIPATSAAPLTSSLNTVQAAVEKGNPHAAAGALGAFDNKLEALVKSGKITEATAAAPQDMSTRVQSALESM